MRPFSIVVSLLLCVSLSAAWPWPPSFQSFNNALIRRQNNNDNNNNNDQGNGQPQAAKTGESAAASTAAATGTAETTNGKQASETGKAATTGTSTGDSKKGQKTSAGTKTTSISINPVLPAGGIEMLTPASLSTTYFKIGEYVTMVWNYTSLQVTPTAVNVIASNANGEWTITSNMTVKQTGSVVWNTNDTGSNPLAVASYTLVVYDAKTAITAAPQAGYLSPYNGFQFAMYTPQLAIPLKDFVCLTCSGAVSNLERQSMAVIFGTAIVTVLSFSWFASGFLQVL